MHTATLLQATPVIFMCKSNSLVNETGLYQASCGNKKHTEAKNWHTTSKTFVEVVVCKSKCLHVMLKDQNSVLFLYICDEL